MEHVQFGGRRVSGFGVGIAPQSTFVKSADLSGSDFGRKVGAFVGGAVMSGAAAVAATALLGEGSVAWTGAGQRVLRNWRSLAATAAVGGVFAAVAK